MRFVCGSCDYNTDLLEKLKGHYMTAHTLSHGDASVMCQSNVGELMSGQDWFSNFYELVKAWRAEMRRLGPDKLQINSKGYLEMARKAAGLK